jgi:hypothetical protein
MNLSSSNLTVVSTNGSSFPLDSAYLVESDLVIGTTHAERSSLAVDKGQSLAWILGQGEPKFISKNLMYEIEGWVYDSDEPEFKYLVPLGSGNFYMVDCWIVNEKGRIHPGYSCAGVAIGTQRFNAVGDSPFLES